MRAEKPGGVLPEHMKRAAVSEQGIFLVIFGIIVTLGILVLLPIFNILFGGGGTAHTATTSLDTLSQQVYIVLNDPAQFSAVRNHPLFIEVNGYIIVAFNEGDDTVRSGCYDEAVRRPVSCPKAAACLCVYKDANGRDFTAGDDPPLSCKSFPRQVTFVAPANNLEEGGDPTKKWNMGVSLGAPSITDPNHENLLLYGECDAMEWGWQKTYVEKYPLGAKSQIYISREWRYTQERFETFSKQFQPSV